MLGALPHVLELHAQREAVRGAASVRVHDRDVVAAGGQGHEVGAAVAPPRVRRLPWLLKDLQQAARLIAGFRCSRQCEDRRPSAAVVLL